MKPFNLELALAGCTVITRNRKIVTEIHHLPTACDDDDEIVFVADGIIYTATIAGRYLNPDSDSDQDLFMATVKKKVWISIAHQKLDGGLATSHCYDTRTELIRKFGHSNEYTHHEIEIEV